ncbi:phosphomannomutase/phosphoglucomutase [Candidatus Uhrbacteria bacterium]|nr:phosphomannomutase/phosphoglucomutase [Candidatus Uhrbacteria bacterium]
MSIFKAYDIRGTIPDQLDEQAIKNIAWACVAYLEELSEDASRTLSVVIGRDNRETSAAFAKTAVTTLKESGVDVIDIGLASTPYFYYASSALSCDGGMMITASHNPPQYNGCKLVGAHASAIGADSGLPHIEALYKKGVKPKSKKPGTVTLLDMQNRYADESIVLGGGAKDITPLTVVVDTGNGVSALMCETLFQKLPIRLIPLFFELDGTFPHHMPNPLEEKNTEMLRKTVVETHADIGIAMDADGDRVIFIDENGRAISSDLITALLAIDVLTYAPGATILYDLRSSRTVQETIRAHGGNAGVTRVGHAFIKTQMRKQHALFAGELSGHFYYKFQDYGYFEASLATIVQMLRILSQEKKPLSEILQPLRRYWGTGEINFEVANKAEMLQKLERQFSDASRIDKLDGITLEYDEWWCNVRPSNTENLLRLTLEAKTKELRDKKCEEIKKIIEK